MYIVIKKNSDSIFTYLFICFKDFTYILNQLFSYIPYFITRQNIYIYIYQSNDNIRYVKYKNPCISIQK